MSTKSRFNPPPLWRQGYDAALEDLIEWIKVELDDFNPGEYSLTAGDILWHLHKERLK
jgi:hypothetical protein